MLGKASFSQLAAHFLYTRAVCVLWTLKGSLCTASRFPLLVHTMSPGFPLLAHKVIHTRFPQFWITPVEYL